MMTARLLSATKSTYPTFVKLFGSILAVPTRTVRPCIGTKKSYTHRRPLAATMRAVVIAMPRKNARRTTAAIVFMPVAAVHAK
ncbi:MAG: hypothetical protein BWY06_00162 [Candidatus Latescibacteria bacterium ADurb.Bin168]|nr:MAG: hypothetical protein BWY06_00162 [Candidatus Latescibacteria bacterium ADurb.Bin168]